METRRIEKNGKTVAVVDSPEVILHDAGSALDFLATIRYESGCDRIALNKGAVVEDFFDLRTGLAGEMLQKFVNYRCKLALYGDFSVYTSKALRDFIYESNRGNAIYFAASVEEAVERLTRDNCIVS